MEFLFLPVTIISIKITIKISVAFEVEVEIAVEVEVAVEVEIAVAVEESEKIEQMPVSPAGSWPTATNSVLEQKRNRRCLL